eukprot:2569418-Pyramimonas_sp.AAC.1
MVAVAAPAEDGRHELLQRRRRHVWGADGANALPLLSRAEDERQGVPARDSRSTRRRHERELSEMSDPRRRDS